MKFHLKQKFQKNNMDNHFGGIIWTNHALNRLKERGIKQGDAWATWNRPEKSYKARLHKGEDAFRYFRNFGDKRIEVVAKQNEKKEWIIISVWSRPVLSGSSNSRFKIHDSRISFWRWLYNQMFRV